MRKDVSLKRGETIVVTERGMEKASCFEKEVMVDMFGRPQGRLAV